MAQPSSRTAFIPERFPVAFCVGRKRAWHDLGGLLRRDPVPQAAEHVLHRQRFLPAIGKLAAICASDGIRRRAEFAKEGEHSIRASAPSPRADAIFPPLHEQADPALMLWKRERDLHLFAAGDAAVDAQALSRMRWISPWLVSSTGQANSRPTR